jgi:hypothetical protein
MLLTMVFFSGFFWDRRAKLYKVEDFKTLINVHTLPGQTEGLKGGFKEWVDGWVAKVDNSFGYDKWTYYSLPLLMKKKKRRKFAS